MSNKHLRLEMDYDSSNTCIQSFTRNCCNWGQRKTPHDKNNNIVGQTAPLWVNPAKKFFCVMFVIFLILSIMFIAGYIVVQYYYKNHRDEDEKMLNGLKPYYIIIGAIILLLNTFYWLFWHLKEYASDQEWSRYTIFLIILWAANLGFLIYEFIYSYDILKKYKDKTDWVNTTIKNTYLTAVILNFCVSGFNAIASIILIIRVFIIAKNFFFSGFVMHDASCEDEDIIIIE